MSSVKIREKNLKNNKVSLYLDVYIDKHNRYTEFLNLYYYRNDKKMKEEVYRIAKKCRNMKELEIIDSKHNENSFKKKYKLRELFNLKKSEVKSKSIYESTWKHLINIVDENIKIIDITQADILSFKNYLISLDLSKNSKRTYFNCLRGIIKYAYRNNFIRNDIMENIKSIKKQETKKVYLTEMEVKEISKVKNLNTSKQKNVKKAFLFSCYTGLRLSDIMKLDYSMIENNKIHFRQKKTTSYEYLPLSKTALNLIKPIKKEGRVFDLPVRKAVNIYLKKIIKKTNIKKNVTYHTSRHTFATMCLTSGVDIYTVSKLLGHKSIETTQIYAQIIDDKKQEAVDKLPEL